MSVWTESRPVRLAVALASSSTRTLVLVINLPMWSAVNIIMINLLKVKRYTIFPIAFISGDLHSLKQWSIEIGMHIFNDYWKWKAYSILISFGFNVLSTQRFFWKWTSCWSFSVISLYKILILDRKLHPGQINNRYMPIYILRIW